MKFSFFTNVWAKTPSQVYDLGKFMEWVRNGRWKNEVEKAREALKVSEEKYSELKRRLPAVTPGGIFEERKREGLKEASGLFVLDFDKKENPSVDWESLKTAFSQDNRVAAAFLSPKGEGLKVFFRHDPANDLARVIEGLTEGLCRRFGAVPDKSGKDISRLCYVSYDPAAYLCPDVAALRVAAEKPVAKTYPMKKEKVKDIPADETEEEIFVRFLDELAAAGVLPYDVGVKVVGAATAFWGAERAAGELRRRWPQGDEKMNFALKCAHPVPCDNPAAMLVDAGKGMGLKLVTRRKSPGTEKTRKKETGEEGNIKEEKESLIDLWNRLARSVMDPFYYDQGSKSYYMDAGEDYILLNGGDVKTRLKILGLGSKRSNILGYSQIDYTLDRIRCEKYLHYAGNLAGHKRGVYRKNGSNILAMSSPEIIEPKEGDWSLLRKLLHDLLGFYDEERYPYAESQKNFLYGWLKVAYETLVSGYSRPGQVLILAGPPGGGKSLLKLLIVEMLGGRMGEPYDYLSGASRFNSDLAGAEVLAVDDVQGTTDVRIRRAVAGKIKNMLFSGKVRIESKGREPFYFTPFWRLVMCVNNEPENLLVLPVISEDIEDKVALIKCSRFVCPEPFYTPTEKAEVMRKMISEIPAFVHYLLNVFVITEGWQNQRTGVRTYHNPELLASIGSIAPENELLSLIDEWNKSQAPNYDLPQTKTANEWRRELTAGDSAQAREARALLDRWNGACGSYLGKLARSHSDRVVKAGMVTGTQHWTIYPAKDDHEKEK